MRQTQTRNENLALDIIGDTEDNEFCLLNPGWY